MYKLVCAAMQKLKCVLLKTVQFVDLDIRVESKTKLSLNMNLKCDNLIVAHSPHFSLNINTYFVKTPGVTFTHAT